jgi:hypothetical protein
VLDLFLDCDENNSDTMTTFCIQPLLPDPGWGAYVHIRHVSDDAQRHTTCETAGASQYYVRPGG